ncbi:helix-turn-helix transcriptional regulator [Cytobacillus massiliigabonensis]|uniref:helix-turn-helix transcriptional regulator n=1 Tax=Cytobacillus massiliigabonensis TaxID=1871011 RepID=UPI000C819FA6|nr:metalloregulator ArsR/SmtB family transcription factor [Cytobacillus massiliigabonensis]
MVSRVSTRDKILELLKKETNLTVNELSKSLGITEMAVRKHLNILDRDLFLAIKEVRQPMGRPILVYSLSQKANDLFPKSYENMTVEFLNDLKELHGEGIIDYLLEKRSERLKNSYIMHMKHKNFEEKIVELKNIQIKKGYMADVTRIDNKTFELVEYNCPIFAVAKEYKKACSCETEMFKEVLGTSNVKRLTCKADNDAHCRFLIKDYDSE